MFDLGIMPEAVKTLTKYTPIEADFCPLWFRFAEFFRIRICRKDQLKTSTIAAEHCYEMAQKCDPKKGEVWERRALFYKQAGQLEKYQAFVDGGLTAAPDNYELWATKGRNAYTAKDFEEAVRYMRTCCELIEAPTATGYALGLYRSIFVDSLNRLASSLLPDELDRAQALLEEAELFRARHKIESDGGLIGFAQIAYHRGDHEASLKHADQAIETTDSQYGWLYKASALNNLDRMEEALIALEETEKRQADFWSCHLVRACIFSKLGRTDACLEQLYKAAECEGSNELKSLVEQEKDFDPMREDPGFIEFNELLETST